MRRPTNPDEFLDLRGQAIFETGDLIASAHEEEEDADFSAYLPIYERRYTQLQALHDAVREGRHEFATGSDLACMPLARKWKSRISFADIREVLNGAHLRRF